MVIKVDGDIAIIYMQLPSNKWIGSRYLLVPLLWDPSIRNPLTGVIVTLTVSHGVISPSLNVTL